ncbi:hypothetical protein Acr_22g0008570 [Actinidia rufa]|uniref:Uncharacterized protein n=1 Tax=Actinidia rufa TaxID=165716 RepID=A0A7J0GKW2_9ERIC|nr:hypothetical protein Acr_22g0008570 [Actinidia rufa]
MASQSSNRFSSRETRRETLHAPKTLGGRRVKLLDDAQRTARATSRQNPCRFLLGGGDSWDMTIQRLQTQLGQHGTVLAESITSRTPSSTDLREILNAKHSRGGDLHDKLISRTAATSGKNIIPAGSTLEQPGPSQGNQSRGTRRRSPETSGNGSAREIYATKVHTIRREVRSEIPHQLCQIDDGTLKSLECNDVPGVSIKPRSDAQPPADLRDLMSRVEMFARLEDDFRQEERNTGSTPRAVLQEACDPKGAINGGSAPITRKKDTEPSLHRHKTTAGVYSRFPFSHLINSQPTKSMARAIKEWDDPCWWVLRE